MTALDDILHLRFDETGRNLLVIDLNAPWIGEFPPSVMVHWQNVTMLLAIEAVEDPVVLEVEASSFGDGDFIDSRVLRVGVADGPLMNDPPTT